MAPAPLLSNLISHFAVIHGIEIDQLALDVGLCAPLTLYIKCANVIEF